jgi:hypothetical protein
MRFLTDIDPGIGCDRTREARMSNGARRERRRVGRHRRMVLSWSVETLEGRVLLSGATEPTGATVPAAIQVHSVQRATTTSLQSSTKTTAAGNHVILVATVHTADARLVTSGRVRFSVISPTPEVIGSARVDKVGEATIQSPRLVDAETYEIQAEYIPSSRFFATSDGNVSVSIARAAATSFRINAPHFFGAPGSPVTFSVTALDRAGQPVTDFTGTIDVFSPTDHSADVLTPQYTFTTADQGTHEFPDGVKFHKGGAEILKVDQVNNTRIQGTATFGIE